MERSSRPRRKCVGRGRWFLRPLLALTLEQEAGTPEAPALALHLLPWPCHRQGMTGKLPGPPRRASPPRPQRSTQGVRPGSESACPCFNLVSSCLKAKLNRKRNDKELDGERRTRMLKCLPPPHQLAPRGLHRVPHSQAAQVLCETLLCLPCLQTSRQSSSCPVLTQGARSLTRWAAFPLSNSWDGSS